MTEHCAGTMAAARVTQNRCVQLQQQLCQRSPYGGENKRRLQSGIAKCIQVCEAASVARKPAPAPT
jgi:hypothetical protein